MTHEAKYNLLVSYIKGINGAVNEIYENSGEVNVAGLIDQILNEIKYLDGLENEMEI